MSDEIIITKSRSYSFSPSSKVKINTEKKIWKSEPEMRYESLTQGIFKVFAINLEFLRSPSYF